MFVLFIEQLGKSKIGNFNDTIMFQNIGQFKISMHDFVLDEGLKPVQDLYKILDGFFFWDVFLFLEVGSEVAFITVLQNQVDVINSLLDINKPNDIVVATRLKDLNFVIKKLSEFTWN
jgi:hypothetical protein